MNITLEIASNVKILLDLYCCLCYKDLFSPFEEMLEDLYKKISSWKSEDLQRIENDADHLLQDVIKKFEGKLPK